MKTLHTIWLRVRSLWQHPVLKREIDEELQFHIEQRTADNIATGMAPDEAAREARKRFGNVLAIREECQEMSGTRWLDDFFRDLSYAVRSLKRDFRFTIAAVFILTLAIGLNTTIFCVVNPVLFRSLPFEKPEELVYLNASNPKQGFQYMSISYADFCDWRRQNHTFANMGVYGGDRFTISGADTAEQVGGLKISSALFPVLGVRPMIGRNFTETEDKPGAAPVVLLSHGLWQRRFGADPDILGRVVTLNGRDHTVTGIMPPGFGFPAHAELWIPLVVESPEKNRGNHSYAGIGRLKKGVTLEQAREDLKVIGDRLAREYPVECANVSALALPLREQFLGNVKPLGWILLAAAAFVVVVACANVSNLFLARALGRQKEFAVRAALGAGRSRLIRQLLVESLLLAGLGGILGTACSFWGRDLVLGLVSGMEIPHWIRFDMDYRVLGFAIGLSMLTCVLFGLAPALHAVRPDIQANLQSTGRGSGEGRRHNRLRGILIASEVALAILLLSGTGLMLRTVVNLGKVDPGFNPIRLACFYLDLPSSRYGRPEDRILFYNTLQERLRALPGVESVAAISAPPMGDNNNGFSYIIEGRPLPQPGEAPVGNTRVATPGYFAALQIPLLRGRDFTSFDNDKSPQVIIIDATLANRFFVEQNPIGQRIKFGISPDSSNPWMEIVGVVGEVKHYGLDQDIRPGFYIPHLQNPWPNMAVVLRTSGENPLAIMPSVRQVLGGLDRSLAVSHPVSMPENIKRTFWLKRFIGQLFGVFSLLALALAAAGIAGVVIYSVAQRTREIGIRMALGAPRRDVLLLVLKQGMKPVLIGLVLGLIVSLGLNRVLSGQLYQVSGSDPCTLAVSVIVLGAVAVLACYLPARRATKINPLEALRQE